MNLPCQQELEGIIEANFREIDVLLERVKPFLYQGLIVSLVGTGLSIVSYWRPIALLVAVPALVWAYFILLRARGISTKARIVLDQNNTHLAALMFSRIAINDYIVQLGEEKK